MCCVLFYMHCSKIQPDFNKCTIVSFKNDGSFSLITQEWSLQHSLRKIMHSSLWLQQISLLSVIVADWLSRAFFLVKSNLLTDEGSVDLLIHHPSVKFGSLKPLVSCYHLRCPAYFRGTSFLTISHWVQSLLYKDLSPVSCCPITGASLLEMTKRTENGPRIGFEI